MKDKIGSAIRGSPKLITPFKKPPIDSANNINNIEFKSRSINISGTFHIQYNITIMNLNCFNKVFFRCHNVLNIFNFSILERSSTLFLKLFKIFLPIS